MIRKLIKSFKSLNADEQVKHAVIAVSGGTDSTALLHCLAESCETLNIGISAAHLNHRTRGKESDADETFVRRMCKKLDVPCVVKRTDVPRMAKRQNISLEMAARKARYVFLKAEARKHSGSAIITAHNLDDQAETMLIKLARGAGMRGLAGITGRGEIEGTVLIRPMLNITRREVEAFLKRRRIEWREDSSNYSSGYLRNRVRHRIIPLLESDLNPDIKSTLARTADVMREEDSLLQALAEEAMATCKVSNSELDLGGLLREHRAIIRRVIMTWLISNGVAARHIDLHLIASIEKLMVSRKANTLLPVSGGYHIVREYDRLCLSKSPRAPIPDFREKLPVPGRILVNGAGVIVEAVRGRGIIKERGVPGQYPCKATISSKAIGRKAITVRSWKKGDRINPMGMSGSKKLKDVFIDLKVPASIRGRIPVFECGGGIIWVPGYRVARGWEVKPGETSLCLTVLKA